MGRQAVEGLVGYHLNLLTAVLAIGDQLPKESNRNSRGRGGCDVQGKTASATSSRWQRGRKRSATPCWIHPSRWRRGCSTTTRTATTRCPARSSTARPWATSPGRTSLDNITLYWLTGTGVSAARSYWEDARALAAALASGQALRRSPCRSALPTFPGEIWASRAAGSRRSTPASPTSTRPTGRALRRLRGAGALLRRGAGRIQWRRADREALVGLRHVLDWWSLLSGERLVLIDRLLGVQGDTVVEEDRAGRSVGVRHITPASSRAPRHRRPPGRIRGLSTIVNPHFCKTRSEANSCALRHVRVEGAVSTRRREG